MKKIIIVLALLISGFISAQCWQQIAGATSLFGNHSIGIQTDGTLWAWGLNEDGQLGDGTTTNRTLPTQIGMDTDWAVVAAGSNFSYAIKQNGTLWAWGANNKGQLSDDTTIGRLSPAQVLVGTTWLQVNAGDEFVVAQKSDGTLWACGFNAFNQLGLGDVSDRLIFTQNSTITDWQNISCNNRHTVLRRSDNSIWGFGQGTLGSLATGTNIGLSTPSLLPLLSSNDWTEATAGIASSHFRKNDGSIWSVGQNQLGTLGVGFNSSSVYPLTMAGSETDWLTIQNSSLHTIAIKNDSSLWATGSNNAGQLGIGVSGNRNVFTQVGTATNWAKVRVGRQHTLALTTNGTLYSWGLNSSGQLGLGNTTNRNVPTLVGTPCTLNVNAFEKTVMRLLGNPVENQVQLSFTHDGIKKLTMYNAQGQLLLERTVSDDFVSFDVSGFAAGLYLIQCSSEMGSQTVRVVKR